MPAARACSGQGAVSAYVKISDGCDRFCSYCTIPLIRGRYRSFPLADVCAEVDAHVARGVREIVLVAQDTGRWGTDFDAPSSLAALLSALAERHPRTWFRVMYVQPEGVDDALLDAVAAHANVCPYFDVPLQHVDPELLSAMNRRGSRAEFEDLARRIRERVPGAVLRTTLIAGFPGETEEQFQSLCDFVEDAPFDYVGVFAYSREEGTRAFGLPGQLDEDEKAERAQRLRDVADAACLPRIAARVGREMDVLVEGREEDGQLFGRAMCQAPEVDGVVYLDAGEVGRWCACASWTRCSTRWRANGHERDGRARGGAEGEAVDAGERGHARAHLLRAGVRGGHHHPVAHVDPRMERRRGVEAVDRGGHLRPFGGTDGLDGYLARSRGEVTTFGKFMDPLADKILVAAALLALVELSVLPSWVVIVILAREFIVSGIRMVAASQGVVIAASWYGKAKTVAQMVAIVLFIVKDGVVITDFSGVVRSPLYLVSWAVMIVALVLTIVSMLDYFSKARGLLGFQPAARGGGRGGRRKPAPRAGVSATPRAAGSAGEARAQAARQACRRQAERRRRNVPAGGARVVALAREAGVSVGTAESLTGGLVAAALTSVPGSSACVRGGVVSYACDVKRDALGVDAGLLESRGAVDADVACQMAQGARERLGADVAVAVTGIAGPGGAEPGKPVGTVWLGLAGAHGCACGTPPVRGRPRRGARPDRAVGAVRPRSRPRRGGDVQGG